MATTPALPGLEDRKIEALQNKAIEYAEARDARQELLKTEVALKAELLVLMHKANKESYEYDGVKVEIVHEEETVKVKIAKPKQTDDDEKA